MTNEEAFEKWFNDFHIEEHPHYKELKDFAFAGWEARLAYMQGQSEPVAIVSTHYVYGGNGYGAHKTDRLDIINTTYGKQILKPGDKLYTAPQRQQPLKRLSEDKINEIWGKREHSTSIAAFANAIMDAMERINK